MNELPKTLGDVLNLCEELSDEWASIASWCDSVGLDKEGAIMRRCIGGLWATIQEPIRLSLKADE